MLSKSTRDRFRKCCATNVDAKHAARVGAIAFTIGICGAVVTSPGVAWADGVTGSAGSTSTESNAQPESATSDNQNSPTEANTTPSTTKTSVAESAMTKKLPGLSSLSESVTSVIGRVKTIVRSSGGALTSGRDVTPVVGDVTISEEIPTGSLEDDARSGPVARVLDVFLPQNANGPDAIGQRAPSLAGTERVQQFNAANVAAAHVDATVVPPIGELVPDIGDLTTGIALPPLPKLPFPGPDSPEPVAKAWACLCSVVAKTLPIGQRITDVLNEIFAPIIAGPGPDTPADSPLNWAVLAWVRRQADQVMSSPPISDIMQAGQAYGLQAWQQFMMSCAGPTEGLPEEFERTVLVTGLTEPLDFAFLPDDPEDPNDGGILIAEKGGAIKLYKEGQPTTTVATLPVKTDFESGIGGIEVDPNYEQNHYVYVTYTNASNEDMLSRFTFEGDADDIRASEVVLIRTNDAAGPIHHGGEIYYEDNPDGEPDYIYWAKGDNSVGPNAQDLTNLHGKIMRIYAPGTEPVAGQLIPEDNPFVGQVTEEGEPVREEIWAYGLRNPFRFTTTPDGQLLVGDVGGSEWEELNVVEKGANYGWPEAEGTCIGCGEFVNPVYTYPHSTQPAGTGSITSVLVYTGDSYGEEYKGKVFIADYTLGWIKVLDLGSEYDTFVSEQTFDGQAGTPVKLVQGPDGNIYQLNIYPGELSVIAPAGGDRAPTAAITATPSNGYAPLTVNFSSQGSTDPDPGTTLTYNWDFGDGTTSTLANPTHTYDEDGTYAVTLTVSDGEKTDQATQNVTVGSTPPVIGTMTVDRSTYNPGDTITFSADGARDPDPRPNGQELPASAYKWTVLFHHEDHVHPAATIEGQKSGSITIPLEPHAAPDEETWYEIILTVTDESGLSTTRSIDVTPTETTRVVTFDEVPSKL